MPTPTPADRALARHRLLALLLPELRPGDALVVVSPFGAELVGALTLASPAGHLRAIHVVVPDLRAAEAARAAAGLSGGPPVTVRAGAGLADAWDGADEDGRGQPPDVVLLWPDSREGHPRVAAQIREAAALLPHGGRLFLVAFKRQGAEAHLGAVREALGGAEILAHGPRGARIVRALRRPEVPPAPGRSSAPGDVVQAEVLGRRFDFRVAPGVFAHRGLDAGTRLLLEILLGTSADPVHTVLDLGCGYGAIGVVLAAHRPAWRVVMADVDATAVALARENAARNGVAARAAARLSDGLRQLPGQTFDLVASHFPLHIGRAEQERLLREARDALTPGGRVYLAALSAYDLRPLVAEVFGAVDTLAEEMGPAGDRYRVLRTGG